MNRLRSLRNTASRRIQGSSTITDPFRGMYRILSPISGQENRNMSTCNWLALASRPIMPAIPPVSGDRCVRRWLSLSRQAAWLCNASQEYRPLTHTSLRALAHGNSSPVIGVKGGPSPRWQRRPLNVPPTSFSRRGVP